MKNVGLYGVSISAVAALLVGCVGPQSPIGALGAGREGNTVARARVIAHRIQTASSYRVLYSFVSSPDGAQPYASLLDVKGTLYGTTQEGGDKYNAGTVFSIARSGAETVLYRFRGAPDAVNPTTALVHIGATLYGATEHGGAAGSGGAVFSVTRGGAENLLHSFGGKGVDGKRDGVNPGQVIAVGSTIYGTTLLGGVRKHKPGKADGVVFSLTTDGALNVLHGFGQGTDGSSLSDVNGTLYGTTLGGGAHGYGTVFAITTGGREKVVYSFGGIPDGARPTGGLIDVDGTLYGTTQNGGAYGASNCYGGGCGTVYSISTSGNEKVLHRFGNGNDGFSPTGSLVNVKGTLYGTTAVGGAYGGSYHPSGTIFSITPSGKEKVLHSFGNGTDGNRPVAGLIDVKGTLYGTTVAGGTYGYGTVFALTP